MFIAFEGIDGAGKSTQMQRLATALRAAGREVTTCRDPGSTPLGEALRGLVVEGRAVAAKLRSPQPTGSHSPLASAVAALSGEPVEKPPTLDPLRIGSRAEMLTFMAARAQMVEEVIRPALDRGEVVLTDRFLLSNVCYQGYGGGLPTADLWEVGRVACDGLLPDLSLVFDLPVPEALARVLRPRDRMEEKGDDYLERVRAGFLAEAARDPDRIQVINAALPPDELFAEVLSRIVFPKPE